MIIDDPQAYPYVTKADMLDTLKARDLEIQKLKDLLESASGYIHGGPCGEGDDMALDLFIEIAKVIE